MKVRVKFWYFNAFGTSGETCLGSVHILHIQVGGGSLLIFDYGVGVGGQVV